MARMHADEVATDASLVRRLLRDQFPQWAELAVDPVASGGTDNALYRLGDDLVVRLPRLPRSVKALRKERRWLPRLAPLLPLPVPLPRADGVPAEGYPFEWSIYSWLPGDDATRQPSSDGRALAGDLARFVRALQQIDATGGPGPGEHNVFRGAPLALRDASTRAAIESLPDAVDAMRAISVWEEALRAPDLGAAAAVDPRRSRRAEPPRRRRPA